MSKYEFIKIEKKWQEFWDNNKTYKVEEDRSKYSQGKKIVYT